MHTKPAKHTQTAFCLVPDSSTCTAPPSSNWDAATLDWQPCPLTSSALLPSQPAALPYQNVSIDIFVNLHHLRAPLWALNGKASLFTSSGAISVLSCAHLHSSSVLTHWAIHLRTRPRLLLPHTHSAFGTSVGSKTLHLWSACVVAAVFEFLGAMLLGGNVTRTIAGGIANVATFAATPAVFMYGAH